MPRATAQKVYFFRVRVQGRVPFPMDMLRYDRCFPASEGESYKIFSTIKRENDGPVLVELVAVSVRPDWAPTDMRWASFSWRVIGWGAM
jgi:hypothetical protein